MNDFYGLPTGLLENDILRLEYLATAGPRIVRLSYKRQPNLLAELPAVHFELPYGTYNLYGGHRLWCAPESVTDSYAPDNEGLKVVKIRDGVRLTGQVEPATCIVKSIEIRLSPDSATLTLQHEIYNEGYKRVSLAPWALTMLRPGGMAILPQPVGNVDEFGLLHNRIISLWPYTHVEDNRIILKDDFILIKAMPVLPALKLGYFNPFGWLAYWLDGLLFRKTFSGLVHGSYVDGGCNSEIYTDDNVIELESLGIRVCLEHGESCTHLERWEIFSSLSQDFIPLELSKLLE